MFLDETIPPDSFKPLTNPGEAYVTKEELQDIIQNHFKANKSSGLS